MSVLDRLLFWTAIHLKMKLIAFQDYYNKNRTHAALEGRTPLEALESTGADLKCYRWQTHCRGLYQTPIALEQEFAMDSFPDGTSIGRDSILPS